MKAKRIISLAAALVLLLTLLPAGAFARTGVPVSAEKTAVSVRKVRDGGAQEHTFSYALSGDKKTITATCSEEDCADDYDDHGISLTLKAPENLAYDEKPKEATVSGYPTSEVSGLADAPVIRYYKTAAKGSITPVGDELGEAPVKSGNYVAQITWGGKTARTAFTVTAKMITYTVTFKVAHGKWNDKTSKPKEVPLSRREDEDLILKLEDGDIPGVGNEPDNCYEAGDWDVKPRTDIAITEDKEYTYTYAKKPDRIAVAVTKDGAPQEGLGDCLYLKQGTAKWIMPAAYEKGVYELDTTQASSGGSAPGDLPSGDYDLCFDPPAASGFEASSESIICGEAYQISTSFDYYTVSLTKDPAHEDVLDVSIARQGQEPDPSGQVVARIGDHLDIGTSIGKGYHFDGYSVLGTEPVWDSEKAEQTIEVQGTAEIMAHAEENVYTVHFDANQTAGITGEMEDQDMVYDQPQDLFANRFSWVGGEFVEWNTKADGSGTPYSDGKNVMNLTAEEDGTFTLYAQWAPHLYTVTWLDEDGTELGKSLNVPYGQMPEYTGSDPEKEADEGFYYTFIGWDPELEPVTDNAEYTAVYEETARGYGEPVWTWTGSDEAGYTAAEAAFTTNDGRKEFTVKETDDKPAVTRTEPTASADGSIVYTAEVIFGGKSYKDQKTVVLKAKKVYQVVSGNGGWWRKGSSGTIRFVIKATAHDEESMTHFAGIQADGKAVPEKDASGRANYIAKSGSVVIELQKSWLETLSTGKHTVTVQFDDAAGASAVFTVLEKASPSGGGGSGGRSPRTGDESHLGLWLALGAAAAAGLIAAFPVRRRLRKK